MIHPTRQRGSILSVILVALVAAMLSVTPTASAAAQPQGSKLLATVAGAAKASVCTPRVGGGLPGGPGHPGPVWVGTWKCGDLVGFCRDFVLHDPNSDGDVDTVKKLPGLAQRQSDIVSWINGTYRSTGSDSAAKKAGYAIWQVIGGSNFRTYHNWATRNKLFPDVRSGAAAIIAKAKERVGLKLGVHLPEAYVGQTKPGHVKVTGSSGRPVSGVRVNLSVNDNGKLSRTAGVSNGRGIVKFALTKTDSGVVRVRASAQVINVRHILITAPTQGRQRIFVVPNKKRISANASYNKQLGKPTVATVCDTDCDGQATVTVSFTNPKDAAVYRYFGKVRREVVLTMTVQPGVTKSKSVRLVDSNVLKGSYCLVRGGECFTDQVALTPYEVKCPPAPEVYFTAVCDCDGVKGYNVLVVTPDSKRVFKAVARVNGKQVGGVTTLNNGGNTKINVGSIDKNDRIVIVVRVFHQVTNRRLAKWSYTDQAPTVGRVMVAPKV